MVLSMKVDLLKKMDRSLHTAGVFNTLWFQLKGESTINSVRSFSHYRSLWDSLTGNKVAGDNKIADPQSWRLFGKFFEGELSGVCKMWNSESSTNYMEIGERQGEEWTGKVTRYYTEYES